MTVKSRFIVALSSFAFGTIPLASAETLPQPESILVAASSILFFYVAVPASLLVGCIRDNTTKRGTGRHGRERCLLK